MFYEQITNGQQQKLKWAFKLGIAKNGIYRQMDR